MPNRGWRRWGDRDRARPTPGVRRDPTRTEQVEGIGSVLDQLLGRRPWRAGLALGELARRWPEVVGERLGAESIPQSLDGGTLVVRASTSAWASQIGFLAAEVARRANEVMTGVEGGTGPVSKVRVTVDPGPPGR